MGEKILMSHLCFPDYLIIYSKWITQGLLEVAHSLYQQYFNTTALLFVRKERGQFLWQKSD